MPEIVIRQRTSTRSQDGGGVNPLSDGLGGLSWTIWGRVPIRGGGKARLRRPAGQIGRAQSEVPRTCGGLLER